MLRIKYKTERTLVRSLCRLQGQSPEQFKSNVRILKLHFEKFNSNISEICQWLMRIRPEGKTYGQETKEFWFLFLQPSEIIKGVDEKILDKFRADLFEIVAGWRQLDYISNYNLPDDTIKSIKFILTQKENPTISSIYGMLEEIDFTQRMILLKAASEWIVSHYLKGVENWARQYNEWEIEKRKWESEHPQLTDTIKEKYSDIYKQLGIKLKNPRICGGKELLKNIDNCQYAGERIIKYNHSPLCKKYYDFSLKLKASKINPKYFITHITTYLSLRLNDKYSCGEAITELLKNEPRARWFKKAYQDYLEQLGINEETILSRYAGQLPHCASFGTECRFNPHTHDCVLYKEKYSLLSAAEKELEPLYREWRKYYLKSPHKPAFVYPSSNSLPTPKIFGNGYFNIDFDNSNLRLRLDNMAENEYLEFGIKPWPIDYDIQPQQIDISSVNINFSGVRAKAGFRFNIIHHDSRFTIRQEEIDYIRSFKYPRAYQDQLFLDEARELLLKSFNGDIKRELKILTVDLGESGASAAYFIGDKFQEAKPLKIIKIDKLRELKSDSDKKVNRGLVKEHVGFHLQDFSTAAQKIAEKRLEIKTTGELRMHDLRRLSMHIRWMLRDWARLNASQIIKIAEKHQVDLIVFESLRGFNASGYELTDGNKIEKKRRMAFFAYGIIRRKVTEKAVERGMRVITCPYKNSSQVCSICGHEQTNKGLWGKNKQKKLFVCENTTCRNRTDSDKNAAIVLGKVFWGQIKLPTPYH